MAASGPQGERYAAWLLEEAEHGNPINTAEFDLGAPEQRENLDSGIASGYTRQFREIQKQNDILKEYSKRLELELHRLQIKYPEEVLDFAQRGPDAADPQISPPWLGSHTYMAPLLTAYDARIKELENVTAECTSQCERLMKDYQELEVENERRTQELKTEYEKAIHNSENSNDANIGPASSETLHEIHEQLQVLLKENALLTEQVTLLETSEKQLRDELEEKNGALERTMGNFKNAATTLKRLQDSAKILRMEKEYCEQLVQEKSKELGTLHSEREQLKSEIVKRSEEVSNLTGELDEQRKFVEEINERSMAENEFLEHQSMLVVARSKELRSELDHKEKQLDELRETHRQLTIEHSKTRQDCEGMLKVMGGLEKQIVELATREKHANDRAQDAENTKEQAILEREQALSREQQTQQDLKRLQDRIEEQDTHSTAERRKLLESQETKFQQLRTKYETEIRGLLTTNAIVVQEKEQSLRERQQAVENLNALTASVEQEKERMNQTFQEITEKLDHKEKTIQQREEEAMKARQTALALQHQLDVERHELATTAESQSQTISLRNRQLESLRDQVNLLTSEVKEKDQVMLGLRHEIQLLRQQRDSDSETFQKKREAALLSLKQELAASRMELEQHKNTVSVLQRELDEQKNNVSAELQSQRGYNKSLLEEQQQQVQRLKQRNSELTLNMETQQQQTQSLLAEKRWAQVKVGQLNSALQHASRQLRDAKLQIAELLAKEEEHLGILKELRIEKSRLALKQQLAGSIDVYEAKLELKQ